MRGVRRAPRGRKREFLARGLAARDQARATGDYVSEADMLKRLDASLVRARKKHAGNRTR